MISNVLVILLVKNIMRCIIRKEFTSKESLMIELTLLTLLNYVGDNFCQYRNQGYDNYKRTEHTDTFKFGFNFEPRRETEYAMTFDASEELLAGFDISKNIIGLDFNFNAQQEFNNNKHNSAEVSLSKKF